MEENMQNGKNTKNNTQDVYNEEYSKGYVFIGGIAVGVVFSAAIFFSYVLL